MPPRSMKMPRLIRRELALLFQHRVVFPLQLGADRALFALRASDDSGGDALFSRQRPCPVANTFAHHGFAPVYTADCARPTTSGMAESPLNMGTSALSFNEASDMRELLNLQAEETAGSATQCDY